MTHNSLKKQVTPAEFGMKKTDAKLRETQTEIAKVQQKIKDLELKSEEMAQASRTQDRFLGMDKKSSIPAPDISTRPDFNGSLYNKRN